MSNKNPKLYISNFILLCSAFILVALFFAPKIALAAEPGCYSKSINGTVATTTSVTCPSNEPNKIYTEGCWLKIVRDSSNNGTFEGAVCDDISIGTVDAPCNAEETTSIGGAASPTNPLGGVQVKPDPCGILKSNSTHICGSDGVVGNATETSENTNEVHVAFDFGCRGDQSSGVLNPVIDIAFAVFRFLSAGVGLIVIGSIIIAGIQYSASAGDPQATEASKKRIANSLLGLVIFIFMFSIMNFIIPGGLFN